MKIVVKGYQVHEPVDQAGFRTIYRAQHLKSGETVFMTVIGVRPGRDLNALMKRAELSTKLRYPGLVTALDFGLLPQDRFYFTHSALPSLPIKRVLEELNDPVEELFATIHYFIDALEVLNYVHEASLSFRDITLSQLRVSQKEQVILEGFINARPKLESRNVASIVHLPYMAPEQFMGLAADRKTDIYSMGIVLYELLTGELPYQSNYTKMEDYRKGYTPSPLKHRPSLPGELESLVMRALCPRKARYSHVREWIQDLEEFYEKRSFRMKIKDFSKSFKSLFFSNR